MATTIAVVGAGIAGLACARELHGAGHSVAVFDKGRGLGGRIATHRLPLVGFDHGAQYVTARDPGFAAYLDLAANAGVAARWAPSVVGALPAPTDHTPWYVGVPGMSGLARPLATGLDVHQQVRIVEITPDGMGWSLLTTSGDTLGPFDAIVLAVPAPQAADLCESFDDVVATLAHVQMSPCWCVMLAFADRLDVPWDVRVPPTGPLAWIARNSSKPGRAAGWDTWVLHATPTFSREHLDSDAEGVCDVLAAAFREIDGFAGAPRLAAAHRWLYSRVATPFGGACLWDAERRLGLCGDWCIDARVEAGWLSGRALAARIADRARGGLG